MPIEIAETGRFAIAFGCAMALNDDRDFLLIPRR
jgi:hypothetical protein